MVTSYYDEIYIYIYIYIFPSSGAVQKLRWTSWAPIPDKPMVSVDVEQHFNQLIYIYAYYYYYYYNNKLFIKPGYTLKMMATLTDWAGIICSYSQR